MKVKEDRSWAVGLSQEDFTKEFRKRYPAYDVVPDAERWAGREHKYEYHGIDGFNPENMKDEVAKPEKLEPKQFICQGCNKEFTHNIALAGHKRFCKGLLNMRA